MVPTHNSLEHLEQNMSSGVFDFLANIPWLDKALDYIKHKNPVPYGDTSLNFVNDCLGEFGLKTLDEINYNDFLAFGRASNIQRGAIVVIDSSKGHETIFDAGIVIDVKDNAKEKEIYVITVSEGHIRTGIISEFGLPQKFIRPDTFAI